MPPFYAGTLMSFRVFGLECSPPNSMIRSLVLHFFIKSFEFICHFRSAQL